jgi:predicted dehydrogenase
MSTESRKEGRPLRGALIGFGNVAVNAHLPIWQTNEFFRIDAVVEPIPERARLARSLLPEASVYANEELLFARNDLDFVDICTPSALHADVAERACRAGLHVFCEKPLVTSLESLYRIEVANSSRRVLFTVNNWKHAPLWAKALELLSENSIGAVRSLSLTALRPPNAGGGLSDWRRRADMAGGGILLDHGWHHLYMIRNIIRGTPRTVSARMEYTEEIEETVNLLIRFETAEAVLHLTWQASDRRNYGTIEGSRGKILINDDHIILFIGEEAPVRHNFPEALSRGSHHSAWMEKVVEEFRREIQDEGAAGINLAEARWCARLTHLAYQSGREGSRVVPVGDL